MADIVQLCPPTSQDKVVHLDAARRLHAIADALATLDSSNLRTHDDLRRATRVIGLAIVCARAVLADLGDHPSANELVCQADELLSGLSATRTSIFSRPVSKYRLPDTVVPRKE